MTDIDIYGGQDPRDIPNYTAGDAARYLKIPAATIRSWTIGRKYPVTEGEKQFHPLIEIQTKKPLLLTFTNLIELHILRAIRKHHKIDLVKVRKALDYIDAHIKILHPLAHQTFHTDGVDLFIEKYGSLINASQKEQLALKDALKMHLERIFLQAYCPDNQLAKSDKLLKSKISSVKISKSAKDKSST